MKKRALFSLVATTLSVACADSSSERSAAGPAPVLSEVRYVQPPEPISYDLQRSYDAPLDQVVDRAADALRRRGLAILAQSPEKRIILAHYSGDPQPFVDCGEIAARGRGVMPVSAAETTLLLPSQEGTVQVSHTMRLDALVTVRFDDQGQGVTLWPDVYYVLSRLSDETIPSVGTDKIIETVEFGDTGRGIFNDRIGPIVCQSSGLLENSASLL